MDMPDEVKRDFGFGLSQAQKGKFPDIGKPLSGFGGSSVVELVMDHGEGTFRAVYTVRFAEIVAVTCVSKEEQEGHKDPETGYRVGPI